ncbi:TonB family protein [Loktanella agnita]|uniref:cell envelope integrity protein TolA n=1 Tax=Loktanella agnita TaxID=287097 RepID=UPI0039887AE1
MLEIAVFAALAIALHIAAFATAGERGAQSQGAGGETLVSLAGASAQVEQMVAEWETPPDVTESVTEVMPPPPPVADTLPTLTMPEAPLAPRALPQMIPQSPDAVSTPTVDTAPAEPPSQTALTSSQRPQARPVQRRQEQQDARQEQRAAGTGGGAQAGQSGQSAATTVSSGRAAELQAVWGAQIRSRIENRKRRPSGARGGGRVVVALNVSREGQLLSVSIRQSSGVAAFDQAALRAVSRAGRFPAAPAELAAPSYRFALPITFER